jgi:O-antigen/teichoic acid export membrane protein
MTASRGTAERVARNASLKALVQATRLLSLAFVILAARRLGPADFGKFTFAYATATLLGAALDVGMHTILVRSIARAREDTAAYLGAAVTLKCVLLVPAGLLLAVFPVLTHRPADTTAAVWLLGGALVLQSFIELAVCVFTGFERLEFELGLRIVEKLVLFAVGTAGLALGAGLFAATGAFTVAGGVSVVLGGVMVHRRFARLAWRWDPAGARALARAVGPVAAAFVFGFATSRVVPLLVAILAGDLAAGHLGAAIRVLDVVLVGPVIVIAAVYPVLSRLDRGDPQFRRVVVHVVAVLLMLGVPVALGLVLGAPWLIRLVYGPRFAAAAGVLEILGASAALGFVTSFLGVVLIALDRPGRLVWVGATSLLATLLLTPGLVLALGARGGAVAILLGDVIAMAGCLVALIPFIRLPFDRAVLKIGAAALAAGILATGLDAGSGARMAAALVVYAAVVVALRPVPRALWARLLRGVVGAPPLAEGSR